MKYPVFFRILAVFTILMGLTGLFGFIICVVNGMQNIWFGQQHGVVVLGNAAFWLLIAAFAWFFASRHSYRFLSTTFASLLAVAVLFGYTAFTLSKRQVYEKEQVALFIVAAILFVLALFNLLGLFYLPVRNWANQKNTSQKTTTSLMIYGIFLLTIALSHVATWWVGKSWKREIVMYTVSEWRDTDGNIREFPMPLSTDGSFQVSFDDGKEMEFDAIKIPIPTDGSPAIAGVKIEFDRAIDQEVGFQREGNFLVAHFSPVKSNGIRLYPRTKAPSAKPVWLPEITIVRYVPYFDPRSYAHFVKYQNVEEVPFYGEYTASGEGEEDEEDPDLIPRFSELVLGFSDSDTSNNKYYFTQGDIFLTDTDYGWGMFTGDSYTVRDFGCNAVKRYLKRESVNDTLEYDALYNSLFKELAGINAFVEGDWSDENPYYFSHVNPEAVKWMSIHLIPDPDTRIRGYTTAELYNKIFQHYCRLLVLSHEHVTHKMDFAQEKSAYQQAMQEEGFDGSVWLDGRYGTALKDHLDEADWNGEQRPSLLIGFWLRRGIDTSEDELWNGLKRIMHRYDSEWSQENIRSDDEGL